MIDRRRRRSNPLAIVLVLQSLLLPAVVPAAPVVGFIEGWTTAGDTYGWAGGSHYDNPGTGGVLGANDGYLEFSTVPGGGLLGTYSASASYAGDWIAAGIRSVEFWLNDIHQDEAVEIHFSIGSGHASVWQYNQGFDPPHQAWARYVVDLTDSTKFTRLSFPGSTSFQEALRSVNRVHFRHDLPPFTGLPNPPQPESVIADVAVDQFTLSDATVPTVPSTWGRIKLLYR